MKQKNKITIMMLFTFFMIFLSFGIVNAENYFEESDMFVPLKDYTIGELEKPKFWSNFWNNLMPLAFISTKSGQATASGQFRIVGNAYTVGTTRIENGKFPNGNWAAAGQQCKVGEYILVYEYEIVNNQMRYKRDLFDNIYKKEFSNDIIVFGNYWLSSFSGYYGYLCLERLSGSDTFHYEYYCRNGQITSSDDRNANFFCPSMTCKASQRAFSSIQSRNNLESAFCTEKQDLPPACQHSVGQWSSCVNNRQYRTITNADCSTFRDEQPCGFTNPTPTNPTNPNTPETPSIPTNPPVLVVVKESAVYDREKGAVIGRVEIENKGGRMTETYLIEMQVVPKGAKTFSFVSEQKTCDPNYPTNVHRNFMIGAGEKAVLELYVSDNLLKTGFYDVYFLTRKKCWADMSESEKQLGNDWWVTEPYQGYKKAGTVGVGSAEELEKLKSGLRFVPYILMIAGIIIAIWYLPIGLYIFGAGALLWLLMILKAIFFG